MWHREHQRWYSPTLGRDMELLVLGHAGARMLVFPTSQGRYFEWEDRGMGAALARQLQNGWLQMFCVDSVDAESWYDRGKWPGDRAWRHELYDRYLHDEVLPFTSHRNANPYLIATGASLGAYHAVNFAFRHPHAVNRVIGMSGLYNIKELTRGYNDATVYAHDPSSFLQREGDAEWYAAMQRMDIILCIGRDDPHYQDNVHLSNVLSQRGISHAFRPWDGWAHDWPYWVQMIRTYIDGSD
ncbi:MAG TPA: alpha/beta hydrolase-fold protein [Longimicrobiales bacterium]|nr:alpha/beta hydrolase-fold protein [Longimicrobiales bacterium]